MLDAAEIATIRMERCRDLARTPTGVEHGLLQNEEERGPQAGRAGRRRAAARAPSAEPLRRRRPPPVRQAAAERDERPHRAPRPAGTGSSTPGRYSALFMTGSPKRDQLGAGGWTTKDRLRHDPLGVLTSGAEHQQAGVKCGRIQMGRVMTLSGLR